MATDPAVLEHKRWLGYVQPVGLVVSIPALVQARAILNRNFAPNHRRFIDALPAGRDGEPVPEIPCFPAFARAVLDWAEQDLWGAPGAPALPESLCATLETYGETLRPNYALRDDRPSDPERPWLLLVQELPKGTPLDEPLAVDSHHWQATPQARFERLLRGTGVPTGLLVNGAEIRLVYAPKGEASGHLTFKVAEMAQVAGRPIFAAFQELLSAERQYSMSPNETLPAILAESRKYQNVVSTKLAGQVLEALYELLRGFQAADDQSGGALLRDVLGRDPNHVYEGLLTVLLRLVFLLFAEDRGLLSTDPVYVNHYSVTGLYERLRADDGRYHDTMDQRYGGWAQLLVLFRLIYRGGRHGGLQIPAREGYLFDANRYLFLEGRPGEAARPEVPRVSDGVLFRVLSKLMVLDGERLSYRRLEVEQIGSVYETIMGFDLEVASGPSIAIRSKKRNGAPATINLESLLAQKAGERAKWLKERTDQDLSGRAADALNAAVSIADLLAALERQIAHAVTPNVVPKGAMVFQPSDERRRSGSHYTPSALTEPIVEAALTPALRSLGENPTPEQILNLTVCDPAMGSGAFLVAACRQLGAALVTSWHAHKAVPKLPPDEDEMLSAKRQVAQRCLYGVDKNRLAGDLAKLSLWLETLAKDHPFTFLDHSLRHGDSLAGLTRQQIAALHWAPEAQLTHLEQQMRSTIDRVIKFRGQIREAADDVKYTSLQTKLDNAEGQLMLFRQAGDVVLAAFFSEEKPRLREAARVHMAKHVVSAFTGTFSLEDEEALREAAATVRRGSRGVVPFHWELEFPEVFAAGGFDAIVGNPPFAGKNTLISGHADGYLDWLKALHEESHGNADLVAHFFRRAFTLLKPGGCFGLIATNTIGQGDTRSTGLRWICTNGGTIYRARKRLKWPGEAAVVVSVVHVCRGAAAGPFLLDNREVPVITAYLFHAGGHEDPAHLKANEGKSFQGSIVLGMGFTFDDTDRKGIATPLAEMERLIAKDPRNKERVFPYIGGEEVNDSPTHAHHRYVINFEDFPLRREDLGACWEDADEDQQRQWLREGVVPLDYPDPVAEDWPDLLDIVERKVRPQRAADNRENYRRLWWQYAERRPGLMSALEEIRRAFVVSRVTNSFAFAGLPAQMVHAESLVIIVGEPWTLFASLQSRVHEIWARFMASSMKDDLRYTPSDCFETFPFPPGYESNAAFETAGRTYYEARACLLQRHSFGLTKLYNEFHNPDSELDGIQGLRDLHEALDRVVLDSYGWDDIQPTCDYVPEFDDGEEAGDETGRPGRQKFRYRWPDEIRDDVLARLLDLNRKRAEEEELAATPVKPVFGQAPPKKGRRK